MEIKDLVKNAYSNAKEKGFHDNGTNIGESLMLIVSELSEALEAHRKNGVNHRSMINIFNLKHEDEFREKFEAHLKDTFIDEIADAFIRLADLCGSQNIDIDTAIELKMRYNKMRPKFHGKQY